MRSNHGYLQIESIVPVQTACTGGIRIALKEDKQSALPGKEFLPQSWLDQSTKEEDNNQSINQSRYVKSNTNC